MSATATTALPSTRAHLSALFGELDRGFIVTSTVTDHRWRSRCWRPDQLAAAARWCTAVSDAGSNVYLRATTLAEPVPPRRRGGADQTGAVLALWCDVDVAGPGHQPPGDGPPLPPHLGAARGILGDLPTPSITIHSGGGLHGWWILERPLYLDTDDDRAEAQRLARRSGDGLVELGRRHGWHVDAVGDLSRVLRPAGTRRFKPGVTPNIVSVDSCGEWPPGLAVDPHWRPGPRYGIAELEAAIVEPPAAEPAPARPAPSRHASTFGPADALSETLSWADILEPAGWALVGHSAVCGSPVELWRRPGPDVASHYSLKASEEGWAVAWSDACGLPSGAGQKLSKWRVWAALYYGGDERAAGRAVRAEARSRQ